MADLVATFSSAFPNPALSRDVPLAVGKMARTQLIAIGADTVTGTLVVAEGEFVVRLKAGAACWVSIGPATDEEAEPPVVGPDPTVIGDGGAILAWQLAEGEVLDLTVSAGEAVAVVELAAIGAS